MSEFRGTANEFKQTWEKEVNFEEEAKSLSLSNLDAESVSRLDSLESPDTTTIVPEAPAIRAADPDSFKHLMSAVEEKAETTEPVEIPQINDKKNWL